MRTAVVRVDVDPTGELSPQQLTEGMATLRALAAQSGIEVVDNNLAVMPRGRREAEMLIVGADPQELQQTAITMCANAFGTQPRAGTLTYVSRGTDEDARGVLAGFGLTGEIERTAGDDGYDIISVTLRKADMARIPESRVHTALEASTNCEVHIRLV
ncbi:hypothetical protein [Mycobacterium sp. M26]|uniref:hypothetical protein n=1 Tax=Mycobacterium sp. M26 TaxID=1762962 RepID=UPI00073ECF0C|nr:hypothetical protein [Mycobacterium sp. M26]